MLRNSSSSESNRAQQQLSGEAARLETAPRLLLTSFPVRGCLLNEAEINFAHERSWWGHTASPLLQPISFPHRSSQRRRPQWGCKQRYYDGLLAYRGGFCCYSPTLRFCEATRLLPTLSYARRNSGKVGLSKYAFGMGEFFEQSLPWEKFSAPPLF